ncbi:hypothetical protein ACFYNZ_14655 [Streptomyces kebangsaanensis]|uniref:Secreted protein n=1 Tax=Streptomyces kebangsaanensis TaxID=864058 RepID=A0ABW6KW81_9ACTN
MKMNSHSHVAGRMARLGVVAGAALLIGASPMTAGNAFAADQETAVRHSTETVGERFSEKTRQLVDDVEDVLSRLPSPVNGWQ